jgi:C4-dicarboxylate-specific signal transduction histidine kinase
MSDILNNAKDALVDAKTRNASIRIKISEYTQYSITTISDNGGGISEEILTRLGEPYVSSKIKSGTGLGIYMSKIIVEKHLNGSLDWKNNDLGACFTIKLPLHNKG